ncbi:16187_t:CDS:2, partial [Funneliformis caledonium]
MKSFIFTLIFVLITSPSGFSRDTNNDDACARISTGYEQSNRDPEFSANYSDVKACFEAFPYDREIAENTIETIKKTLQGFFVYLSQAKEEPKQGYSFRSVDLIKELDSLLLKNYTSEFQFMLNVNNLIAELKDPHLRFIPLCYQKFIYSQQLSLYSVINKEGVQIIKIFDDEIDSNNVDCEVTHIDGRPSMEVIKEFAEERIDVSKDSGVRFNDALASLRINEIGDRIISARMFTLRNVLPEKSSIEYSLLCANDINTTFTREWKIGSVYYDRFNTTDDFRNAFCLKNEIIDESVNVSKMFEPKIYNKPMVECEL